MASRRRRRLLPMASLLPETGEDNCRFFVIIRSTLSKTDGDRAGLGGAVRTLAGFFEDGGEQPARTRGLRKIRSQPPLLRELDIF